MHVIAMQINYLSRGKITPNMITAVSVIMHLPIAYLIATNNYIVAAVLLVIFGLFDALDGELARLQKVANNAGMLLDASTDRIKEVVLYIGVVYSLILSADSYQLAARIAATAVAACGFSLVVSYVKAKGETAVKDSKLTANEINRLFQDGFLRYEVRMFLLVVGLLSNTLLYAITVIALLSFLTSLDRLNRIYRKLA